MDIPWNLLVHPGLSFISCCVNFVTCWIHFDLWEVPRGAQGLYGGPLGLVEAPRLVLGLLVDVLGCL